MCALKRDGLSTQGAWLVIMKFVLIGMVAQIYSIITSFSVYVTGFAKKGLIRTITKYRFEILNAVYLENA